ncbi:MAG TPA: tetratricopeptide repeat protein [Sphingomicrobium sp.]|nr:tetratricopeptide repeat protein [Sphingomicrobium sp.]
MRYPVSAQLRVTALLMLVLPISAVGAQYGGGGMTPPPTIDMPQGIDAGLEYRKGIQALKVQRFAEAKKAFGRVLEVAPKDPNTNYLAGLAHAGLSDLKNARKHYERAVKYDPSMVVAHQELGVTYARLGQLDKAQVELANLNALATKCGGGCAKAGSLKSAIAQVTTAIAGVRR